MTQTANHRPSWTTRAAIRMVDSVLSHVRYGNLEIRLPDGSLKTYSGPESGPQASIEIKRWSLFDRLARQGDVGLGEGYTAGDYECADLTSLIRFFIRNEEALERRYRRVAWLGKFVDRLSHLARSNSLTGSRRNISDHYDLSNGMFESFLDDSMTYSCAYFSRPEDTLAEAQRNKRRMIIEKLRLRPEHHLLEIGSGWGSLAIDAARASGCRVTSVTLSTEQLELARENVRKAGLEGQVSIELCDYRKIQGKFDRIVSVEMIEAVGHEFLPSYFKSLDSLLAPDGIVVLQAITIPDQRYEETRRGCDWIQKHIFPGSLLPSLTALSNAMTGHSQLIVEHVENIGIHYARTLREWRNAFTASSERLRSLGFDDDFRRKWFYYFSYCEAAFATRTLGDLQLVLTRPGNRALPQAEAC